jgi:hypothetical protein
MRNLNLLAAVAATLLVGGTAVAMEDKPAGAPKEKKICKADEDSTSRITKKICRTRAEWDRRSNREAQNDANAKLRRIDRAR